MTKASVPRVKRSQTRTPRTPAPPSGAAAVAADLRLLKARMLDYARRRDERERAVYEACAVIADQAGANVVAHRIREAAKAALKEPRA